ncbi:MAG: ABC transporter substrate-binding protein [Deltaproteobacteria bacterium]|nr:ABC transporter substrate-binding protein [Deltaproteobacteria bacterium]
MKKLSVIALVAICIGVFSFVQPVTAADPIPLGVLLPYTGDWAWVGAGADPGVDLAAKEINADKSLLPIGRPVKLYKEDTETKSKPAIEGARKLYDVHKVVGIVGPTSATVRSVIPLSKEAGALEISPTAGTTKLDVIGGGIDDEHIYRTVSSDVVMTAGMVYYAVKKFKPKKVATFTADTEGSRSIYGGVVDACKVKGLNLVTEIEFPLNQASYRAELKKLFKEKPDVIFWEANPETDATIFKQWYEMGLGGQWIGSDFANRTSAKAALPASEGAIGVNPGVLENERTRAWEKRLNKISGKEGVTPFSPNSYDATIIFALAIEKAKSAARGDIVKAARAVAQPPGVKVYNYADGVKALRAGKDINYEGIAGTQDWNKFGDPITYLKVEVMTKDDPSGMKRIGTVTPDDINDIIAGVLKIRAERAK